uniref:Glucagon n=1 Tax=Amphilophus citrinellus TaxID=61819 RepID=A0A3Q0T118_AMPCI
MKSIHSLAGILLVLGFVQSSWQVPVHDDSLSSGVFSHIEQETLNASCEASYVMCLCFFSAAEKRHADGTFTSDVSSYLKDQAIKDFVAKLKSGQVRRESEMERRGETFNKRHVDGSFTSDVNKVLDSIAAKEYLLWVMTSKPSGESKKRQADE